MPVAAYAASLLTVPSCVAPQRARPSGVARKSPPRSLLQPFSILFSLFVALSSGLLLWKCSWQIFCVKGTGSVLFLHLFLHHPLETFISRLYMKRLTPDICWALALTQRVAVSIHLCAGLTPLPAHPSVFLVFWMLWVSRAIHQCSGSSSQLSFHNITVSPLHFAEKSILCGSPAQFSKKVGGL